MKTAFVVGPTLNGKSLLFYLCLSSTYSIPIVNSITGETPKETAFLSKEPNPFSRTARVGMMMTTGTTVHHTARSPTLHARTAFDLIEGPLINAQEFETVVSGSGCLSSCFHSVLRQSLHTGITGGVGWPPGEYHYIR